MILEHFFFEITMVQSCLFSISFIRKVEINSDQHMINFRWFCLFYFLMMSLNFCNATAYFYFPISYLRSLIFIKTTILLLINQHLLKFTTKPPLCRMLLKLLLVRKKFSQWFGFPSYQFVLCFCVFFFMMMFMFSNVFFGIFNFIMFCYIALLY